jgi:molybdopterin molybdotransferase
MPYAWQNPAEMLGVDVALERVLAAFQPLDVVELPLLEALDLVVASDVIASDAVPHFRNSAMDGFALRSADTSQATNARPVALRVVETVAAGEVSRRALAAGGAVRIMTGAPLPDGADCVARFEEVLEGAGGIRLSRPIIAGENVRAPGEDIAVGDVVARAGAQLRPVELGLLAALNQPRVRVHRRPRVAILATGNELVEPGATARLLPGQIRNSNSYTVAALVARAGGLPQLLGVARDAADDLSAKLASADAPDLLVTSGGVSVGDYDMVKDVLRAQGCVDIWQVRLKPGKPLAFGRLNGVPLLGLPGNPLAALVSFEQFGRPAIRRMLGHVDVCLPEVEATLTEALSNRGGRRHFMRGLLTSRGDALRVRPSGAHGAGMLLSLAQANCLIVVPEERTTVAAGERVRVQLLDGAWPAVE